MSNTPFLQANSISKIYAGAYQSGIRNVSIEMHPGNITAIIGASGSGKSTLLKLLYGLLDPDEGTVLFNGERIWGPSEKLIPGHDDMKMVTQHTDELNLYAKVRENVSALLPNTDLKAKREKTEYILAKLNMLHMSDKQVADLSGGEKQRVAIARALVTQPQVLLLDEPFNQVDASFREGLQQDIRQIVQDTGLTVIIVSHDPAEVLSMADRLIVLKDGKIIEDGLPRAIYQNPAHVYTAQLLTNCNVLTREEAKSLGISSKKNTVVVYPHYIDIAGGIVINGWVVKQVVFKGFYEELILEHNGVRIRVLNRKHGKYKTGDRVKAKAWGYLEYN